MINRHSPVPKSNLKRLFRAEPPARDSALPVGQVTCPNCLVVMNRVALGDPGESTLSAATYRCSRCKTQTTRWIKE